MTSTAELQAIRERDAKFDPEKLARRGLKDSAAADRRTLLALYDAQSDEVRRLKELLTEALPHVKFAAASGVAPVATLRKICAALGSQP